MTQLPESTRKQIEQEADEYASGPEGNHDKSWTYEMLSKGYLKGATRYAEMLAVAESSLDNIAASSPEIEATSLDVLYETNECSEAWEATARRRRKLAREGLERLKQMREGK